MIKKPFSPVELNQVIFFITSRCNLRCQHCFNWQNLNTQGELTLEEIKKISKNTPNFQLLMISGGEPFLREDIVEVVKTFRENNHILGVGIPTNGTLGDIVIEKTKQLLAIDPKMDVNMYFSIDGVGDVHDTIRGVPGTFPKAVETLKKLGAIKKDYPNLSIHINSVISHLSIDGLGDLMNYFIDQKIDFINGHYFEIVRGEPLNNETKDVHTQKLKTLYARLLDYQNNIWERRGGSWLTRKLNGALAKANMRFIYQTQYNNFVSKKDWPMPCLAGRSIFALNHNGTVQQCELRKVIGNIRDYDYDISKMMNTKAYQDELKQIEKDRCFCTHICFFTESMYKSKRVVLFELPIAFVKNLLSKF
jgi:MoaA/NifB/PqqE/SkfB family radical SAM enzyme